MPVWAFSPPAFATSGPCDESPCSFFTLFQGLGSRWKQNLVVVLSHLLVTVSQVDIRWWEKNNLPLPESCTLGDPYTNKSVFPIPTNRSALDPASATVDFLIPSLVSFMCILNHLQAGLSCSAIIFSIFSFHSWKPVHFTACWILSHLCSASAPDPRFGQSKIRKSIIRAMCNNIRRKTGRESEAVGTWQDLSGIYTPKFICI